MRYRQHIDRLLPINAFPMCASALMIVDRARNMASDSITLDQVAAHTAVLAVACSRCDRAGKYGLDTLIARHGPGLGIPELLRLLSDDCPKR
jgi:hypothetical protein